MNGSEIYNEILQNTHNLKGTWEVTTENYLKVDGMTNGSIVLFDQTVGALGDFILEWTAEQKGGSYIHSNLCPSLRYTPEDAGTEGGGDNYAMLVYLCNYGGNPGTFNLRTENGTKSTVNTSGVSLNLDTVYTFKFERIKGKYRLYQDGVLINEASDITEKKLYLGWYLWYGGSNSDYQTNFILREYSITKINTYHYLDTLGLTTLWSKIKSLFATKAELNAKANDSDVVHKNGEETITNKKTFADGIYGKYIEFTQNSGETHGGFIDFHYAGSTDDNTSRIIETTKGNLNINGCDFKNGAVSGSVKLVGNADLVTNTSDATYTNIVGGTSSSISPFLQLVGSTWGYEPNRGIFILGANNGTNRCDLQGKPDGTLTWASKHLDCIDSSSANWIRYSTGLQIVFSMAPIVFNNSTTTSATVTLPVAFRDGNYQVIPTNSGGDTGYIFDLSVTSHTTTSFAIYCKNSTNITANRNIRYIAIGFWK